MSLPMPSPVIVRIIRDKTERQRENMKRKGYEKIEFTYGFAVLYNGKRIALCADEDAADAVIASGKKSK